MKTDSIKMGFAVAIAILFGFICKIIAPEEGSRDWISLIVTAITTGGALIPTIAVTYENVRRGVSVRVLAGLTTLLLMASNLLFSCFTYNIDAYIAINLMIMVVGLFGVYGLNKINN